MSEGSASKKEPMDDSRGSSEEIHVRKSNFFLPRGNGGNPRLHSIRVRNSIILITLFEVLLNAVLILDQPFLCFLLETWDFHHNRMEVRNSTLAREFKS